MNTANTSKNYKITRNAWEEQGDIIISKMHKLRLASKQWFYILNTLICNGECQVILSG